MKRPLVAALVVAVAVVSLARTSEAHQTGETLLVASYNGTATDPGLHIAADLTVDELDAAYGLSLATDPPAAIERHTSELIELISRRVSIVDVGSHTWTLHVNGLRASAVDGYTTLHADLTAEPPDAGGATSLELRWKVITDVLYSHKVFVTGIDTRGTTNLLGTITHYQPTFTLTLDAAAPATPPPPTSLLLVGFEHFRAGTDHLLFVSLLALGAARRSTRRRAAVGHLAVLSIAFTAGHSVSLALASAGVLALPGRAVEAAIAVTIVAAAIHAARPVVSGRREIVITATFGLIHGCGFAGTLAAVSLHGWALARPVLTFNVGLEAGQLLALAALAYPMIRLARFRVATFAVTGAIGIVALSWVIERVFRTTNPVATAIAPVVATPERLAIAVFVISLLMRRSARSSLDADETPSPAVGALQQAT